MGQYSAICRVTVLAVCLMPNHFHLIVRIEEGGDLSEFMKRLCHKYSSFVNGRLHRTGTIFQGRFKHSLVDTQKYFRTLCRYVHLNPVEAGLAQNPASYPYSNYLETLGRRKMIPSSPEFIVECFGGQDQYEKYVTLEVGGVIKVANDLLDDLERMNAL